METPSSTPRRPSRVPAPAVVGTARPGPDAPVGARLQWWRTARRLSQLDLSLQTGISARHLSFIETGRSRPSREMVLRLSDELDLALRDRNALLLAAGFAPVYAERSLDEPGLTAVQDAIGRMLVSHEPYPAVVVDRHWNVLQSNTSAKILTDGGDPALMASPVNVYRASLHPDGMARRIVNLGEWRAHLLHRLRRQIEATGDPVLADLYDEVSAYPYPDPAPEIEPPGPAAFIIPLRLRDPVGELSFFGVISTFGTALDVTVSELVIEAFYPADARTAAVLQARTALRRQDVQTVVTR